jgi:uncharacterized protein YdaU (DUF1376 family)
MNYYPFHLGDYAIDTAHLSNDEDLCYRRAIDLYMLQEGPLKADEANAKQTLSRRLRVAEQTLENVLNEFFTLTEYGWEHARCDAEIAKFRAKSERAKEAGRLGGKGKQANAKQTPSKRLANAKLTNNQEPITNNQDKLKENALTLPFSDTDFADAWHDWTQHRKEKKKPLTPTSTKLQLQTLQDMGVDRAIRAIDHSIAQGWTGIFEPSEQGKGKQQPINPKPNL